MKENPKLYGNIIFEYSFKDAVEDKVIKNFDTLIGLYRENVQTVNVRVNYKRLIHDICTVISERKCKRILVYTKTVIENDYDPSIELLQEHIQCFEHHIEFITAKTKVSERENLLERFREENEEIQIIASCRTMGEGVDLVNCDMVVMLDLTRSEILTIQRGLRASRLTKTERETGVWKNALVYFPLNISAQEFHSFVEIEDKQKFLDENVRKSQYEAPMRILNAIKENFKMDVKWNIQSRGNINRKMPDGEEKQNRYQNQNKVEMRLNPVDDDQFTWDYDENDLKQKLSSILFLLGQK